MTFADARAIPAQDMSTIQQQQDDIQRQHQDLLRQQELERRAPIDTPPDGFAPPPGAKPPAVLEDGVCMEIQTFFVEGVQFMPADVINVVTAEYADRCLNLDHINALLGEIGNWYLDRGYVTTRVYLPPQDLTTGTLRILVVEGRAEDLTFRPEQDKRGRLATAFPGVEGEVLNIRDLEQGLDQLNRLPSNDAKLKLEPGVREGFTTVVIESDPAKRWRVSYTVDNSGSKSTGVRQRTVAVAVDDIFGLNDMWSLEIKPDRNGPGDYGSRTLSGSASIPYGYWTIGYSESWFTYASIVQATTQAYRSTGISRQKKATLERVVHRDQDSKISVEAALTMKESRNLIAGTLLETQSRKLTVGALTARHSTKVLGGSANISLGYERGLRALGAKKDHFLASGDPRAQFDKITGSTQFSRPFQVVAQNLVASTAWTGQWAPHTLFGSERLSAGGLSTVRGFKDASASGDVGGTVRNELSWYAPQIRLSPIDNTFGQFAPYGAFDAGWIKSDPVEAQENGVVMGWALGLRTSGKIITLDVAWSEPIARPHHVAKTSGELYASVEVGF